MTECKMGNKVIIIFIIFIIFRRLKLFYQSDEASLQRTIEVKEAARSRLSERLWVVAEEQEVVCKETNKVLLTQFHGLCASLQLLFFLPLSFSEWFLICCFLMNHPNPSGGPELVYFLSLTVQTTSGEVEFSTCWGRLQVRRLRVEVVWCRRCSWGEAAGGGGTAGPEGGAFWALWVWEEQEPEERKLKNLNLKATETVCSLPTIKI